MDELTRERFWPTYRSRLRVHGTRSMYVYGCRCNDCKEAHNDYQRAYRKRKREAA